MNSLVLQWLQENILSSSILYHSIFNKLFFEILSDHKARFIFYFLFQLFTLRLASVFTTAHAITGIPANSQGYFSNWLRRVRTAYYVGKLSVDCDSTRTVAVTTCCLIIRLLVLVELLVFGLRIYLVLL